MKAFRSPLAARLLADPEARAQLRQFVGPTAATIEDPAHAPRVTVRSDGKEVSYRLVVVSPKAA